MPRTRNCTEISLDERDSCTFHCHISSRAHRDPNLRLGQCWSVIDTVPCHGDEPAFRLKPLDRVYLLVGKYLRNHIIDPEFARYRSRRGFAVAREHDDSDTFGMQSSDSFRRTRFDRIRDTDKTNGFTIAAHEHCGLAISAQRFRGFQQGRHIDPKVFHESTIS